MKQKRHVRITPIILYIIGFGFITYSAYWFIKTAFKAESTLSEVLPETKTLNKEYKQLITVESQNKVRVIRTINNKVRNAFSILECDSNILMIYKIGVMAHSSLNQIIKLEQKNADITTNIIYKGFNEGLLKFNYASGPPPKALDIYLTFWGRSLKKLHENESIVNYYLELQNLSIAYEKNGVRDICVASDEGRFIHKNIPVSVLFLKRNNAVYFMLMTGKNEKETLRPNLLYELIEGAFKQ